MFQEKIYGGLTFDLNCSNPPLFTPCLFHNSLLCSDHQQVSKFMIFADCFPPFCSGFVINIMAPFQDDLRWVCQHHRWTKSHHDFQLHNPSLSPWQVIFRSHIYPHQNHPHKVYVVNLIKIDPIHIYRVVFFTGSALKVLSAGDGKIPNKKVKVRVCHRYMWSFNSNFHFFAHMIHLLQKIWKIYDFSTRKTIDRTSRLIWELWHM